MRFSTALLAGMSAVALVPALAVGGIAWWVIERTADRVERDAGLILVDQERERLQQSAVEGAEAVSRRLVEFQRDIDVLRLLAANALGRPDAVQQPAGQPALAGLYADRDTAGLPAWGFVHPQVGAYADWERRSPAGVGGVWVRPSVVRALREDPVRGAEVAGIIRAMMPISPVINAVRDKHADACGLVWMVSQAGVNLVSVSRLHLDALKADPSLADYDATRSDRFQEFAPARNPTRRSGWMQPYLDPIRREWMTSVLGPVHAGDRFVGVLGADIRLTDLVRWLQSRRVGRDGYAFMLADDGVPMAIPGAAIADLCADLLQAQLLSEALGEAGMDPGGAPVLERPLVVPDGLQSVLAGMTAQESGSLIVPLGGEDKILAFAPVAGTRWSFALVQPVHEATSAAHAAQAGIAAAAGSGRAALALSVAVAALSAAAAGAWLGLRMARPLRRFAHLAARPGGSGGWRSLPAASGTELAEIATGFNRLAGEAAEQRELFSAVFDGIGDAVLLYDGAAMTVLLANRRCGELLGWRSEELRGLRLGDFAAGEPPYSTREAEAWFAQAQMGGTPVFPWRMRHRSGRHLWVEVGLRQVRVAGRVLVVGVMQDIGARLAAQDALQRAHEEWDRAFAAVPDGVAILDGDGLVVTANRAMLDLLALGPERVSGRRFHELLDLGPHGGGCPCARLAPGDGIHRFHVRSPALDRHLHLIVAPLVRDGALSGSVHVVRDVSEAVRQDERLRQVARLDAIGQMAGGVAHDVNNQLTGVLGFAELLARQTEGEHQRFAEGIATAARRAGDLTRRLLDLARCGRLRHELVDTHLLVRETAEMLHRSMDRRIEVRLRLDAPRAGILGDPSQLQNALLNLGLNARDAMPDGGVLTFSSAVEMLADRAFGAEVEAGPFLRLEVADSGQGMDESVRRRLFEPFFTTKVPGRGTGLGLASVRSAVRHHHGAVTVESTPGRGTVFALHLPLAAASVTTVPAPAESDAAEDGGLRILVVDDEPVVRELAVLQLAELGHRPVPCRDGVEAVGVLAAAPDDIDLVLLDLVMPRLSGRDAMHRLRAINPRVRVLVSSGYSLDGEARAALDEGADGFLQKPFRIDELAAAVHGARPAG